MPSNMKHKDAAGPPSGRDRIRNRELLRRLASGDHDAWSDLVKTYTGLLFSLARNTFLRHGRHASHQDAEDAVAAAWKNILDNDMRLLNSCIERGEILPLLHTLVRNRSVDMMRKMGSDPYSRTASGDMPEVADESGQDAAEESPSPKDVELAIESLSKKEQTCIRLFFLQERSYREIAEITGIPLNSIGPTIHRAVLKLRAILKK